VNILESRIRRLESVLGDLPSGGNGEGATVEIGAGAVLQALLALWDIGYFFPGDAETTRSKLTTLANLSEEPPEFVALAEAILLLGPMKPEERAEWFARHGLGKYTLGVMDKIEELSDEDRERVDASGAPRPVSAEELAVVAALREVGRRKTAKEVAEGHKKPKHKGKP
jgi:hypothetical protein